MNSYDPQKAARVWQRVQQTQEDHREDNWPGMMGEALALSAAFQVLARQLPRHSQTLQKLSREQQRTAMALRGICLLTQGTAPALQLPPAPQGRPEAALRKCYARTLRQLLAFEQKCDHREYGPVLRLLADREREHCGSIMEIMGETGK